MRYALISDIHSNLEAFTAVLENIEKSHIDRVLFLGDIIGYGPNPNECLDLLLEVADLTLGGNHDWAVIGKTPDDYFNPFAKAAVDWTNENLRKDLGDFLMRTRATDTFDGIQLAHSSPLKPELWLYIMSQTDAIENYQSMEGDVCFIGHSHQPIIMEFSGPESVRASRDPFMTLDQDKKYIINVGSVGQPRDLNPDACWTIFDSEIGSVEFHRTPYDIQAVQKKMEDAGLPRYLIERLAKGR